ncbi:Uncharacterized protein FWK35_00023791 [Aphis craccivora]|uniref:Uncharacterized protein n=1 Tax=Aphis craccivora TaxID=307492 RepID=A0A6G0Y4U6_APHCR|nr:Uncharacterized protein FWK35_00023791 [Aphis craccivora]
MYSIQEIKNESYEEFLGKMETQLITNSNVKETISTLLEAQVEYHIVTEIAKQYNLTSGIIIFINLLLFEISKLEGRPLLLPINEKARPMVEKELQVAVKEIKRIFVCKTELRDACLDQLRQSLNLTRNNLTRDHIYNYIRQGNKENVVVVWNGHSDKTILNRLDIDYSILNITCYDK